MQGWIRIYRELLDKPIWKCSTPEQCKILITLLLMANHEENEWEWQGKKFKVAPGQFITSLDNIAKECGKGITIQNVRTALNKFEKYGFLTNVSTKTGRLITIVNWGLYQEEKRKVNKDINKDLTKSQQRPNKELTPNKNDKNDKNDKKNIYSDIFNLYLEQGIIKHNKLTDAMKKSIDKANKKFSIDEIKLAITRYGAMYRDKENAYAKGYCKYKWTLQELLTREKGISEFLDEGGKWIRYTDKQQTYKASANGSQNKEDWRL